MQPGLTSAQVSRAVPGHNICILVFQGGKCLRNLRIIASIDSLTCVVPNLVFLMGKKITYAVASTKNQPLLPNSGAQIAII